MDRTDLNLCINALLADIQTRTGMNISLEIDDRYDGDAPHITLKYDGLKTIGLLPNGDLQEANLGFTLLLNSRTANGGQLAGLIYSETQIAKVFFKGNMMSTTDISLFDLNVAGYEVRYYLTWGDKIRIDESDYTREFELNLTINKE